MRTPHRLLAIAAALAAAACSADLGGLRQPVGPHFTITTSTVTCPDTISVGQSAQCTAYFYDENHNLVSTTPTWGTNTPTLDSVSTTGVVKGLAVGTADVHATAGSVTGSKNVYVKPGISGSIDGPSPVRKFETCNWQVNASGGTPPYSYSWHISGAAGSVTDDTFEGYLVGSTAIYTVTVTDANGVTKDIGRTILGNFSAPLC